MFGTPIKHRINKHAKASEKYQVDIVGEKQTEISFGTGFQTS